MGLKSLKKKMHYHLEGPLQETIQRQLLRFLKCDRKTFYCQKNQTMLLPQKKAREQQQQQKNRKLLFNAGLDNFI